MDSPIRSMFHMMGLVIVQLYTLKITRIGPRSRREDTQRDRVDDDLAAIRRLHFLATPNASSGVRARGSVLVIPPSTYEKTDAFAIIWPPYEYNTIGIRFTDACQQLPA